MINMSIRSIVAVPGDVPDPNFFEKCWQENYVKEMHTREGDEKEGCERGIFQVGKVTVSLRQWIQRIMIMWLGGWEITKG